MRIITNALNPFIAMVVRYVLWFAVPSLVLSLLLAIGLAGIFNILNTENRVTLTPDIFLPSLHWFDTVSVINHGKESRTSERAHILCVQFQGQRVPFTIIDEDGVKAEQHRQSVLPYGIIQSFNYRLHSPKPKFFQEAKQSSDMLVYLRSDTGIGVPFFIIWFKDAKNLLRTPLLSWLLLFPMILVFISAAAITRVIVDNSRIDIYMVSELAMIFCVYVVLLIIVGSAIDVTRGITNVKVEEYGFSLSKYDFVPPPLVAHIETILTIILCSWAIRLFRRPISQIIPRIGVFCTITVFSTGLVYAVASVIYLSGGMIEVSNHFIDVQQYVPEITIREFEMALGAAPSELEPDGVENFATWSEACPPFERFVLRRLDELN